MEFENFVITAVSTLGLITLLKWLISFISWLWIMFLRPPKNLKEYGSWALVTGPTAGIGKALAFELASKGLNLVLVGRNPSKLEETSREIQDRFNNVGHDHQYRVQVKKVVVDLAKSSGKEIADVIEKETEGLDVGVVINNAGLAYPYPMFLDEVDSKMLESMIRVNIEAVTWITWSILPRMIRKKKGAIVNIGSAASTASSFPLVTVYAATKSYVAMLSRCISLEYKQSGIDIQCQIPVFVATKMTKLKATSLLIPTPETYSKASLRSIGYEKICNPYWSHSIQAAISNMLPSLLTNWCLFSCFVWVNKRIKQTQKNKVIIRE